MRPRIDRILSGGLSAATAEGGAFAHWLAHHSSSDGWVPSELVAGGRVRWTPQKPAQNNVLALDWPKVPWSNLVQSLNQRAVLEVQAWAVGALVVWAAEGGSGVAQASLGGSAVRQDGRSASLTAPNGQAQQGLVHSALDDASVTSDSCQHPRKLAQAAGNAVRAGLPHADAIKAITQNPADAFGMTKLGRLSPGARANVVVWSGDPLELSSSPKHVFIGGKPIPLVSRQTRLRDRYRTLPGSPAPALSVPSPTP